MKEKCGCEVIVDPKTQFETVNPCDKHNTWKRFVNTMPKILKKINKRLSQSDKEQLSGISG